MKRTLLFFILMFASIPLLAQPGPVSVRPDCFQFFTFTVPANGLTFDNRSAGCPYFAIAYSSNGFSVESLVVQVAPDAGGTPGTWVTYTANSGINPNTAITQAFSTFSGYFPWVRVQLTSVTGTGSIQGVLYGWRTPADIIAGGGTSGGCVGTSATPCVVDGPTADGAAATKPPVTAGGTDVNGNVRTLRTNTHGGIAPAGFPAPTGDGVATGANTVGVSDFTTGVIEGSVFVGFPYILNGNFSSGWDRQFACTLSAPVTLTTSGLTKIISGGFGNIRICNLTLSFASPVDVRLVEGTQSVTPCDTGATNMTGLFRSVVSLDPPWGNQAALRAVSSSDDICISMSANVNGGGVVIYADIL